MPRRNRVHWAARTLRHLNLPASFPPGGGRLTDILYRRLNKSAASYSLTPSAALARYAALDRAWPEAEPLGGSGFSRVAYSHRVDSYARRRHSVRAAHDARHNAGVLNSGLSQKECEQQSLHESRPLDGCAIIAARVR
jgi:hypothetical protein